MKLKNLFFLIIFFICNNSIADNKIIPIIEGNANAKVKILVYESLTCSHCANFHKMFTHSKRVFGQRIGLDRI